MAIEVRKEIAFYNKKNKIIAIFVSFETLTRLLWNTINLKVSGDPLGDY